MLYSVKTIILDTRTNQYIEGAVVIDLYVATEVEANDNLFARDVKNQPVIKDGIHRYEETYGLSGQDVWTSHPAPLYSMQHEFACVYQENNDQTFSKIKKFSIKVLFETDINYCPIVTQYFTCTNFYSAYEIAWHRYLLGKVPLPVSCRDAQVNDNFLIVHPTRPQVDIARVIDTNAQEATVIVNNNPNNRLRIQNLHQTQFHAIPLFDDLLITQFGFGSQKLNVHGVSNAESLVKYMSLNGSQTTLCLKKERDGYTFFADNDQLATGYIHVAYLSELQEAMRHLFSIKEDSLWRYLNELLRQYILVSELWTKYNEELAQHPDYSRSQIVAELSKYFNIVVGVVEAEMTRQYM